MQLLFSDNNVNGLGTPELGIALPHKVLFTDAGHWRPDTQVILYSVQCCYALHWTDTDCNIFCNDTQAERSRVLQPDLASKLTFAKNLYAAATILK